MYTPPSCDAINFDSTGSYFIPSCDAINFDVGGDVAPDIISASSTINIEGDLSEIAIGLGLLSADSVINIEGDLQEFEWLVEFNSADAYVNIELSAHDIEILPDIINSSTEVNIESDVAVCRTPIDSDLPIGITPGGTSAIWGYKKLTDVAHHSPFGQGEDVLASFRIPYKKQSTPDNTINCSWRSLDWKDNSVSIPTDQFDLLYDVRTCSSWIVLNILDKEDHVTWGSGKVNVDGTTSIAYKVPYPNDSLKCSGWDEALHYDWHFNTPYNAPGSKDTSKCTIWGPYSYYTLCKGQYYPPKPCYSIPFNFPNKYELNSNVCSNMTFHLNGYDTDPDPRCPWDHWHSGDRDVGSGIIVEDDIVDFPKPQQVYYMLNTVLVREYITNHPIEVLGVSATIDRDSWLWQFQVTVASRDCLEVIMPETGVFKTIIIDINGYQWHCTVEGWSENRSFGPDAWTITGRSPSMMFGNPIDIKHSGVDTSNGAGGQIFDSLVTNKTAPSNWPSGLSSWDTDWTTYSGIGSGFDTHSGQHWCIPANTLSYTDQTTIEIMKSLTDSIGAYIQTHPSENTFNIKPMYRSQPWSWDGTDDDYKGIVEDQCVEISRSYELNPYYNEAYIMGESERANASGTGVEGDGTSIYTKVWNNDGGVATSAPMITDNLLTTSKAAVERGRMTLGNTKEWIKHTLRLSTLCPPGVGMGLFLPGQMIAVKERGFPWYGQVTSCGINVSKSGGGFTVSQILAVEEFIG